jgi:glycosyltransferase involved in cell wall biosynthesis
MSRPTLKTLCLDWHINQSTACRDILADPLEPFCDIELVAWDGASIPDNALDLSSPLIFFQLPPPPSLLESRRARVVWVPMWDQARGYGQGWWDAIPKWVRVISFSEQIRMRAEAAGLPLLNLRYFSDPNAFSPVTWDRDPILFYWNRTGIAGPGLLRKLCEAIGARELIFRPDLDPRIDPRVYYELPERLGKTRVMTISASSREEYLDSTRTANVFLAPRAVEGVGLTLLEAMARGSAVLAFDAPTMNEYVEDGRNGILLSAAPIALRSHLVSRFSTLLGRGAEAYAYQLNDRQDWASIKARDLSALGRCALADHEKGYLNWRESISSYAEFVCDW